MKIIYSEHLRLRLSVRKISEGLPRKIFLEASERFHDTATGNDVAVMKARYRGKERDVMVAYVMENDTAKIITVTPLKFGEKERRVGRGRWTPL